MVDSIEQATDKSDSGPPKRVVTEHRSSGLRTGRIVAIVAGIIGILLTVATPFLPVNQDTAKLSWPQSGSIAGVEAPLVSYAPIDYDATIPCSAVNALAGSGGAVASTIPSGAPDTEKYGFVAKVSPATDQGGAQLQLVLRNLNLLSVPVDQLSGNACSIVVHSDTNRTTATVTGAAKDIAPATLEGDHRPQLVGAFSDLQGAPPAGLSVHATLDTRFTSTPTTLKLLAMIVGVLATIVSLFALHRLDSNDGRRSRRFLPTRWWRFGLSDAVVIGTLILWHFIGATTSDDGYQFTMARTAEHSGYMANYFRYFGVPETPFGTPYYNLFGWLADITTASPFVRLPALLAGIVAWLVISREVVPRLGAAARHNKLALWTGGLVFLAFWLPFNNGLRPEPAIALGVLLTWCSVERMIATRRLLPAAIAILIAGLTLTCGPSGLICFAALFAGLRPLVHILVTRGRKVGYVALLAPLIASGTLILVAAFGDQTFAAVPAMRKAHAFALPNDPWFAEYLRYQWLFNISPDGSIARRFGVLIMVLSIAVGILVMLRKGGRIPGLAAGPARRIIGITLGSMVLMMFTPTKWTHQFGVYAGLAGALAVVAAVAVSARSLRSPRNRALFTAAVLFVMALCFTSENGWWYISSWGIPWWDKPVMIAGFGAGTILLGLTILMVILAVFFHLREPYADHSSGRAARALAISPLTVVAAFMVLFEVLSFAKGAVKQGDSFSLAHSNFQALAGKPCGLANDVLIETDPNASMLRPVSGDPGKALAGTDNDGFSPNGVAGDLSSDEQISTAGTANSVDEKKNDKTSTNTPAGTGGGSGGIGANGSTVALPYGLNPATTPVEGTYGDNKPKTSLTSGWYQLPAPNASGSRGDIISIAAAGRIRAIGPDNVISGGQNLEIEYGTKAPNGSVAAGGRLMPMDIGPEPTWRNLRVPLKELPGNADVIRIVASDNSVDPNQWLAVTPPRVPQTKTLNDIVGSDDPVLLDWAVGLQFPCQRPMNHRDGVAEIPKYRILPDRGGAVSTNLWEDHFGGGPLGWTQELLVAQSIPSYLKDDWTQDWGELERFTSIDKDSKPAQLEKGEQKRSGLWTPGPMTMNF